MTDRLRVAVVGGGVGKQHIEAWQQLASLYDLVAFCDVDPGRAEQVAEIDVLPYQKVIEIGCRCRNAAWASRRADQSSARCGQGCHL
ncbi:MAG: Gfo/Idh/MocA family oxidoreductase [Pseudomonadota bacterium]